jgi:hypothetical protein
MFGRRDNFGELIRSQREESGAWREEVRAWREESQAWREESRASREESRAWREGEASYHRERERKIDAYVEEVREYVEESRAARVEMREFNREILLRNEKVYTAMIARLEENAEQTRANTRAVLSVLDRLESSGGAAAA